MPILIPHDRDTPLTQGDLLGGIRLYYTNAQDNPTSPTGPSYALVISRPCAAVNKAQVVVAIVKPHPMDIPKDLQEQPLKKLVTLLADMRDADGTDVFYIGEIPGSLDGKRYCAKLDFLTTLEVPVEVDARAAWTNTRRKATLHPDFRRDLHTRFFLSIAKQGFEDVGWLSDQDLEMVVDFGKSQVATQRQKLETARSEISLAKGRGTYDAKRKGLDKDCSDAEVAHRDAEKELAPYEAEQAKRRPKEQP
jgi:hypothetical protein